MSSLTVSARGSVAMAREITTGVSTLRAGDARSGDGTRLLQSLGEPGRELAICARLARAQLAEPRPEKREETHEPHDPFELLPRNRDAGVAAVRREQLAPLALAVVVHRR